MNSRELKRVWEHIETINKEMGEVKESIISLRGDMKGQISALTTDMSWIKKFQWAILGTSQRSVCTVSRKRERGGDV